MEWAGMGLPGLGWAGLRWAAPGWAVLGCAGLFWACGADYGGESWWHAKKKAGMECTNN